MYVRHTLNVNFKFLLEIQILCSFANNGDLNTSIKYDTFLFTIRICQKLF